jgi:hypothetical protein
MLALYCCGQQADALEAFHAAWRMPAAAEQPPELDAGTAPPLVGRQSELAWVRQRWERARTGRGSLEHEALENHIRHAIASDAQYGGTHCRCISDLGVSP